MADENIPSPGVPHVTAGLVTEEQMAQWAGLEVSQIRLMLSGSVPIPPHLEGIIPRPVTQGYVWDAQDVQGLPERIAQARADHERAEALRLEEEAAAAEAERLAAFEVPETIVPGSLYEFQEAREAHRAAAVEEFGGDIPAFVPASRNKRKRVREDGVSVGWWRALFLAAGPKEPKEPKPQKEPKVKAVKEPKPPKPAREPKPPKPVKEPKVKAPKPVKEPKARRDETTDTTVIPGVVTAQSNTRRSLRDPFAPTAEDLRTADAFPFEGAPVETPAPGGFDELLTDPDTEIIAAPLTGAEKRAAANAARAEKAAAAKAAKAEKAAAAKAAKAEKAAIAKANRELKKTPEARDARKVSGTVKKTGAEKAAERKAAAAAKREDALASKAAKAARDAAYKEASERWKIDVKIAKETGTIPPRKPKRPKNDTSKPKPIDVINAIRGLATMLENSPGELDAISVMAEEYEGTQLGEAFLRIKTRLVERNASMVEAFAPETVFPVEVHNMLAVGEKTIDPGPALRTAVKLMDSASDAKRKLMGEIFQPILVGLMSLAALFATAYGVMPTFVDMYEGLDMPVPPISAAVIAGSNIAVWVLGISAIITAAYLLWWFVFGRKWDKYRTWLDAYKLHMPMMGEANKNNATYQLIKVLSSYINVGAHEREALLDAAAATSNRAIRKHLETTAELMLAGRRTFADAFDSDMFPNLARRVLRVAEEAGRMKNALVDLEAVFEREAAESLRQGIGKVSGTIAGISSLIFTVVVTMVTVPPLEMFGSTLSYGQ